MVFSLDGKNTSGQTIPTLEKHMQALPFLVSVLKTSGSITSIADIVSHLASYVPQNSRKVASIVVWLEQLVAGRDGILGTEDDLVPPFVFEQLTHAVRGGTISTIVRNILYGKRQPPSMTSHSIHVDVKEEETQSNEGRPSCSSPPPPPISPAHVILQPLWSRLLKCCLAPPMSK
jgi:hypothetical protein